jgi:hypothetical protein
MNLSHHARPLAHGIDALSRSLVVYHYFERDAVYIRNLAHFLVFGYSANTDFLIVIAGDCTVDLPRRENIRYLFTENRNNDFGGYCEAMRFLGDCALDYDFVYFVNASVRGPFTPPHGCSDWQQPFLERLTGEVGLAGTTINILSPESPYSQGFQMRHGGCAPFSHVQTMAYAMPRATLAFLRESNFYAVDTVLSKRSVFRSGYCEMVGILLRCCLNTARSITAGLTAISIR